MNKAELELDRRWRKRRVRHAVRVLILIVAVFLLVTAPHESRLPVLVPALSPLTTVASLLTTRTFLATSWIGLSIAFVVLIRRRWFCRWVCPTGTCADCTSFLGKRLGRRCPRLPSFGQWILLFTLGGAVLGIPFLLWLDPLALFSGMFGVLDLDAIPSPRWAAIGMGLVLIVSLAWPGVWCTHLCPLGACQDLWYRLTRALPVSRTTLREPAQRKTGTALTRRVVLGMGVGTISAVVTRRLTASTPPRLLRPPAAADEDRFVHLCIRCGNCLRACPTNIIRPDHGDGGVVGLLAPTLQFKDDYCTEGCMQCTLVCPSGALMPITTEEGKTQATIGVPQVDMAICLLGDDRECSKCKNWCPYEAITLKFSEEEYTLVPQIDLAKCPGCGACQVACPTTPTKAIVIVPFPAT
jgi:ferredoxin-type protein NapF